VRFGLGAMPTLGVGMLVKRSHAHGFGVGHGTPYHVPRGRRCLTPLRRMEQYGEPGLIQGNRCRQAGGQP